MSRVDASAASDDDAAAVREEVSAFLGRLTRDWVPPGDAARGEMMSSVVAAREDPAEDPSRDAPRPGPSAPPIHDTSANYLHRAAVDEEVRSVLDAMRRATIDLSPAASRAMRAEARRNDDGTVDGHDFDPGAPEPYVADGVLPPWYAKSYYKVVAVRDDSAHVSVYDGVTRYEIGTTVCHPAAPDHGGGLYVSPTVEGCLRRDRDLFPPASALLDAPRAIAKVRCWNPDRADDPVFYGRKMAFTCCHVDEILPYPTTWGWRGGGETEEEEVYFATGTGTGTGGLTGTGGFPSPSPSRRGTRSLPATPARVVGLDPGSGSGSGSGFLTPAARAPRGGRGQDRLVAVSSVREGRGAAGAAVGRPRQGAGGDDRAGGGREGHGEAARARAVRGGRFRFGRAPTRRNTRERVMAARDGRARAGFRRRRRVRGVAGFRARRGFARAALRACVSSLTCE